jgi:hypothetical protein
MIRANEIDLQLHVVGVAGDQVTSREPADSPAAERPLEVIGGFKVHPLASRFPLIIGKEFDDLVEAVQRAGTVAAVEFYEGLLIDGRNRVRAVEELRRQGVEIEVPTTEWQPKGDETVEEHIFSVNVHRRHLTDDQRVALATEFLPIIRQGRQARQAATRFGASARNTVAQNSSPPEGTAEKPSRTSQEKDAASSVGQLATLCGVSRHKASQGIALDKGLRDGTVSPGDFAAVIRGTKPLRELVSPRRNDSRKKSLSQVSTRTAAECMFDDCWGDADATDSTVDPPPTEEEFRHRWDRYFKQHYAITDHCELRKIALRVIDKERRDFDLGK